MSETKHTPGPWKADDYYSDSDGVLGADGFPVADIQSTAVLGTERLGLRGHWSQHPGKAFIERSTSETQANAHLVAAAPELLEALRFINEKCGLYGPADRAREMARKVIAKAEGRNA